MLISIVVPALNEEQNLPILYQRIRAAISNMQETFELIFVDDGSSDRTAQAIADLHKQDPRVKLLSFSRNFGHQAALSAGLDYAKGDAVISMDADLQHPPEVIPQMIASWKNGAEVVNTIRTSSQGAGLVKRLTSHFYYHLFRKLTGLDIPMHSADFRLLDKKVVHAFRQLPERTRFLRGLAVWVGYRQDRITYSAPERHAGKSQYTLRRMLRLGEHGLVAFTTAPLYMAIYLGFLEVIAGFLYALYILYVFFAHGHLIEGWTSTVLVVVIIGGVQLIMMGLVGLYVGTIYSEVKHRPLYLLRDSLGYEGPTYAPARPPDV